MKTPWEIEMIPRKDKWEVKMTASTGGGNYILPVASSQVLGGVRPEDKTEDMNLPVGVDAEGRLWVSGEVNLEIDTTLTKSGLPADAATVGEKLEELEDKIPKIATDDEIIDRLIEEDMLPAVCDTNGDILSDENENILLW